MVVDAIGPSVRAAFRSPTLARTLIELRAASKSFDGGRTLAVDALDLSVPRGLLTALLGASGSGKTTTLRLVNRLVEPTSGSVLLDGRDVAREEPVKLRRAIGYAIQGAGLFPHRTVGENVATVPRLLGWSRDRIDARVDELLASFDLAPGRFRDRYPHTLSGGQRQRVGLARALAAEPRVLLLDEPFGALDPVLRDELQGQLLTVHRALGLTTLLVTHDVGEALRLADTIGVMADGRLVQTGTPSELLARPATDFVARLMDTPRRHAAHVSELLR